MTNDQLAERVLRIVDSRPPRTPERRAAAALYALGTFGTPDTRAAANALLCQLEREAA